MEDQTVGILITEAREKKGISKNQLAELCGVSHTEIARIESGEREVPNPKTLRKISKYIDVNFNELMYAAGLGLQLGPESSLLKEYYSSLRGPKLKEALVNAFCSLQNCNKFEEFLKKKLEDKKLSKEEKEIVRQTKEDNFYQILTIYETINQLQKALRHEKVENTDEDSLLENDK